MIAVGSDTIRQIGLNHHHDYTLYFFRSAKGFPFIFHTFSKLVFILLNYFNKYT